MSAQPDDTLIALLDRVAARDEAALKALYDLTAGKLMGLAMRVVGKTEWAEDVLQETFLHIWRSAGDYRASLSPPMAWLGLIVRSRSVINPAWMTMIEPGVFIMERGMMLGLKERAER